MCVFLKAKLNLILQEFFVALVNDAVYLNKRNQKKIYASTGIHNKFLMNSVSLWALINKYKHDFYRSVSELTQIYFRDS
jgi:F0F1-type ATP synthase assembly protein I